MSSGTEFQQKAEGRNYSNSQLHSLTTLPTAQARRTLPTAPAACFSTRTQHQRLAVQQQLQQHHSNKDRRYVVQLRSTSHDVSKVFLTSGIVNEVVQRQQHRALLSRVHTKQKTCQNQTLDSPEARLPQFKPKYSPSSTLDTEYRSFQLHRHPSDQTSKAVAAKVPSGTSHLRTY